MKFEIEICRMSYAFKTFEVEADSEDDAETLAMQLACDSDDFTENSSEYDVVGKTMVDPCEKSLS